MQVPKLMASFEKAVQAGLDRNFEPMRKVFSDVIDMTLRARAIEEPFFSREGLYAFDSTPWTPSIAVDVATECRRRALRSAASLR